VSGKSDRAKTIKFAFYMWFAEFYLEMHGGKKATLSIS
jgi:hypothetical protein